MIRRVLTEELPVIYEIINDSALAYEGVIPADRWQIPYMALDELEEQVRQGVEFWCYEMNGHTIGCMGIQKKPGVRLIRHAYVRTKFRSLGVGSRLLSHLCSSTDMPVLVGTWAAAEWAIRFYERHGFQMTSPSLKDHLLRKYWQVPERQMELSVVLALRITGSDIVGRTTTRYINGQRAAGQGD